jgi:nucleoside-diphosphate-sugar epimerase
VAHAFIVGCGDIGRRVGRLLLARGDAVTALNRSAAKTGELAGIGMETVVANLDDAATLTGLATRGSILFYFAPPPGGGNEDPRVRNLCAAIPPGEEPCRLIYLSTSGVYGDCGDAWVTEETPPEPQTARGKRRLDAENFLRRWGRERRVDVIILRVTGIYGPGRLPVTQLMGGHPVLREEEAPFTNRIHADDLARVCLAAADRGEDGEVFNVSDGHPGTMTEYFNAAADLLGLPRPPQIGMAEAERVMPPLMLSYFRESRRLDNRRMRERLGVTLLYPDLKAGLASCRPER